MLTTEAVTEPQKTVFQRGIRPSLAASGKDAGRFGPFVDFPLRAARTRAAKENGLGALAVSGASLSPLRQAVRFWALLIPIIATTAIRVDLIKAWTIEWRRLERADFAMAIGSAASLEDAPC